MKNLLKFVIGVMGLCAAMGASAGGISDTGVNAYWGADRHQYTDVIGATTYEINSATITRVANVLTIAIATNFAGNAGIDSNLLQNGIGYGDLFLAQTWNPFGNDANHVLDNAANGTLWSYGFALDNRYSNSGGSFTLYKLNGGTNAANILNSDDFMKCYQNVSCTYRNGQATAVKTKLADGSSNANVSNTGVTGNWTVTANKEIKFTLDLSKTPELLKYNSLAMHWGETCQNDVIEGQVRLVPVPGALPLSAFGLVLLGLARRRRAMAA